MAVPFDFLPIGDGLRPDGTHGPAFYVSRKTLDRFKKRGYGEKYDDARFLPGTVSNPDAVFEGLKRPNCEECFCYAARPESDPDDEEGEYDAVCRIPRFGQVFVAYVRLNDTGGYVVFDWEWREEDEEPGYPANWQDDFARKIWPPH